MDGTPHRWENKLSLYPSESEADEGWNLCPVILPSNMRCFKFITTYNTDNKTVPGTNNMSLINNRNKRDHMAHIVLHN